MVADAHYNLFVDIQTLYQELKENIDIGGRCTLELIY